MVNRFNYISAYTLKKGLQYISHYGIRGFLTKLRERTKKDDVSYADWFENRKAAQNELEDERHHYFEIQPKISIAVPLYRTKERFLHQMIQSVQAQTYRNWELCIADGSGQECKLSELVSKYSEEDTRIRYTLLEQNKGIGGNTNAAIHMATGDYIGLLDHDDVLAPNALYEVVSVLENTPNIDVIYTDEDKCTEDLSEHFNPSFKPDYSPDLLCSNNYICHFLVVSSEIVQKTAGFLQGFDGAQDYDFIFRCTEQAEKIVHIPKVLYHWRVHELSVADNPLSKKYAYEAGKKAIQRHLERTGKKGIAVQLKDFGFYRVKYVVKDHPLVSVILWLDSQNKRGWKSELPVFQKSDYQNIEVFKITSNKKDRAEVFNKTVSKTRGQYVIFLNAALKTEEAGWIQELVSVCQNTDAAITGGKIYHSDRTVSHAGKIIGGEKFALNAFQGLQRGFSGYMHKASVQRNTSAVDCRFMCIRKDLFLNVGGFDQNAGCFADIDLCLRIREAGYSVVYNPFAAAIELKKTEISDQTEVERVWMKQRYEKIWTEGDPFYNINLDVEKGMYTVKQIRKE